MVATLYSSRHPDYPPTLARASLNKLLIANGVQPMLRWDGLASAADTAGVIAPTQAVTFNGTPPVGSVSGTYTAFLRFVDAEGNLSDLSPISAEVTVSGKKIVYENVQVPGEAKVAKRQLLRNTTGQATTYYVDLETTDLTSTTFTTDNDDETLSLQTAVAVLDADGNALANLYAPPPANKAVLAFHQGRLFAAVEVDFTGGHCAVTNGSTTVTFTGVTLTDSLEGRDLYVVGAPAAYRISDVDVTAGTATLSTAYAGATEPFAVYAIKSPSANRRAIVWSEAGLPEAWPATNSLTIQETGDELTALLSKGTYLYIYERNHIHRFTFQDDPLGDGYASLQASRGVINQRCVVLVEDIQYALDEQGIHAYDGGRVAQPVSGPIQDVFVAGNADYHINWAAAQWFHAEVFPAEETVRWFVALAGNYLPRHALCYHYRLQRWWIEEYPRPIGASELARIKGQQRLVAGSSFVQVFGLGVGTLDVCSPQGKPRGTVTSATLFTLVDTYADFPADAAGAPVFIVDGAGKGQRNVIITASGTTLSCKYPWLQELDSTSVYQIGGINWTWRSSVFEWANEDGESLPRRIGIAFQPLADDAQLDLTIFRDRTATPLEAAVDNTVDGITATADSPYLAVDQTTEEGYAQYRIDGGREGNMTADRYMALELAGVTNREQVRVYQVDLDGVEGPG